MASKPSKNGGNRSPPPGQEALGDREIGQIPPPPPTPRRLRRFKSIKSIRLELAETVHGLKSGTVEVQRGRAVVYALSVLLDAIRGHELEEQIERIAAALDRKENPAS